MIVFANGNGDILKIVPEDVKQGSNKASIIYFVCPTGDNTVNIAFTLPNGKTRPQRVMTRVVDYTQIPQLTDTLGNGYFVWKYELKDALTAYSGQVDVQIFVTAQDGEIVSTPGFTFNVIKGVAPIEPPKDTDSYKDLIAYVTSLFYGKYDKSTGVDITDKKVFVKNDTGTMVTEIMPSMVRVEDSQCKTYYDTTRIMATPKGTNKSNIFNFPDENGTFATREWVQENGGGGSGVEVKIDGVPLVDNNIPIASKDNFGVIKINDGLGLYFNTNVNALMVNKANDSQIKAKTEPYRPIVPNNLDYAVKEGLVGASTNYDDATNEKLALTDDEKVAAQAWLGVDNKLDKFDGSKETGNLRWTVYAQNLGVQTQRPVASEPKEGAIAVYASGDSLRTNLVRNPKDCTNKEYVDNAVANAGGGGTLYEHVIGLTGTDSVDNKTIRFEFRMINHSNTAITLDEALTYLEHRAPNPMPNVAVFIDYEYDSTIAPKYDWDDNNNRIIKWYVGETLHTVLLENASIVDIVIEM